MCVRARVCAANISREWSYGIYPDELTGSGAGHTRSVFACACPRASSVTRDPELHGTQTHENETVTTGEWVMTTVTIEKAQANLAGLIAELKPGEELLITQEDRPVARLVAEPANRRVPRQPGSAIGKLRIVEDDDTHLADFKEYML